MKQAVSVKQAISVHSCGNFLQSACSGWGEGGSQPSCVAGITGELRCPSSIHTGAEDPSSCPYAFLVTADWPISPAYQCVFGFLSLRLWLRGPIRPVSEMPIPPPESSIGLELSWFNVNLVYLRPGVSLSAVAEQLPGIHKALRTISRKQNGTFFVVCLQWVSRTVPASQMTLVSVHSL